ncbi:site-specific integrase [Yinghuangia sp. ASG 101]|uniref:site-specific integrase n=1 Tax=Yinghuangia sp. ASG 101 TaxID=2896848 RepID=UPI001E3A0D8E|nr:site-specific integrase [Yinghuangia sp. ASG 101]UGQ08944.1 site-specific integrase [Yinghuangia sp. ASG 101]
MWSDFDDQAKTLRITHAVKRIKVRDPKPGERKTRLVVHGLKSRRSRRTLLLTPELAALLGKHRTEQKRARDKAGDAGQEHGLIFPSEVGTPFAPDNFSHAFPRAATKAGLGHWHPHELRHSGASLILAQGTPPHVVSEVLGHAGIAITKDVYGHRVEGDKRAAAVSALRGAHGAGEGGPPTSQDQAALPSEPGWSGHS